MSIPSDDICLHQNIVENINGRSIFVIIVIERWTTFYRIYDRQNVLASDISKNRPIWTLISKIEKKVNLLETQLTHFLPISIVPFLNMNVFNWGVSHFEKRISFNSNIFIRAFIVAIANHFWVCQCANADKQIVETRIELDRSEAEKCEFFMSHAFLYCFFFNLIFCFKQTM